MMRISQKVELRKLLLPQLQQSLKILSLSVNELKSIVAEELSKNPFLEETPAVYNANSPVQLKQTKPSPAGTKFNSFSINKYRKKGGHINEDLSANTVSLQEVLLRQLGMFAENEDELKIGQEIIGNIDDNGYLKVPAAEIAALLSEPLEKTERVLRLIQSFDPAGVCARSPAECLLIQLKAARADNDPLTEEIIKHHLPDIAKGNLHIIAKRLKQPQEKIRACVAKILKFDPKPGRNYSREHIKTVIPDIIIEDKGDELAVTINEEELPAVEINNEYRRILKRTDIDAAAKEFLRQKLHGALELLRSISKRNNTLKKVMEVVIDIQGAAIKESFSLLKPLTFKQVAEKIGVYESTVCRVVMNKYVQTPQGILALKNFFPSRLHDNNGQEVSSVHVKTQIKELIDQEDKKKPLSDQKIAFILSSKTGIKAARRTVAKYRESLKILPSCFRKER